MYRAQPPPLLAVLSALIHEKLSKCDWASLMESLNQVSVTPNARTGGEVLSSSKVSLINGSFHRLSLLAAGEILLPFNRSKRESEAGKLGLVVGVEEGSDTVQLRELVGGSFAVVPSRSLISLLEMPSISPTFVGLFLPSYFR